MKYKCSCNLKFLNRHENEAFGLIFQISILNVSNGFLEHLRHQNFYAKNSPSVNSNHGCYSVLIFPNFWHRIFVLKIFENYISWYFFKKNEDCLKSPYHVVISGSVKIRRNGNFFRKFLNNFA